MIKLIRSLFVCFENIRSFRKTFCLFIRFNKPLNRFEKRCCECETVVEFECETVNIANPIFVDLEGLGILEKVDWKLKQGS